MKVININIENIIKIKDYLDTDTRTTKSINSTVKIPTGNYNNIVLNFNFISPNVSEESLNLFAVFKANFLDNPIEVEIGELEVEGQYFEKACVIPVEVLNQNGVVGLGVYGYSLTEDEALDIRFSLEPITFKVEVGSYIDGITPIPTPTAFQVYFNRLRMMENVYAKKSQLNEVNNKLNEVNDELNEKINSNKNSLENETALRVAKDNELNSKITSLANGSPLKASSTSGMTDKTRIYVNTTDGKWYYHNGSSWVVGGVYQATGIGEETISPKSLDNDLKRHIGARIPDFTLTNDYYISNNSLATITEQSGYSYSSPIELHKNEKIYFYGQGYKTNVAMISKCDINGENREKQVLSIDETVQLYSYTADEDCYVVLSGYTTYFDDIFICNELLTKSEYENIEFEENAFVETVRTIVKKSDNPTMIADSYIGYTNGSQADYSNNGSGILNCSDFIELKFCGKAKLVLLEGTKLTTNTDNKGLAIYDKDKNFIVGYQYIMDSTELEFDIPKGAKYIRYTETVKTMLDYEIIYTSLADILDNFNEEETEEKPLDNKIYDGGFMNIFNKVMCIGDSLTIGQLEYKKEDGSTGYQNTPDYSYPSHLKRILNTDVKCLAQGGATAISSWFNRFGDELALEENKSECYIIALGTNDIGYNDSFNGDVTTDINMGDYTSNAATSVGGYSKIIQKILEVQPRAKIFCVAIPNTRHSAEKRSEANTKIKEIASLFGCYVIDLETYGVPVSEVSSWRSKYYLGGHLNSLGYREFAIMISSYIDFIIRNNIDDFKQIAFIGTDLSYT